MATKAQRPWFGASWLGKVGSGTRGLGPRGLGARCAVSLFLLHTLAANAAQPQPQAQGLETVRVTGSLANAAGSPTNGTVHFMPSPASYTRRIHDLGLGDMKSAASVDVTDGTFEVEIPIGIYRLDIETTEGLRVRIDLGEVFKDRELPPLPMPKAVELGIRVVSDAGEPIEGALVLIDTQQWIIEPGTLPGVTLARWHGRTNDAGRLQAPVLPGANHPVRISAEGYIPRGVPSGGKQSVTVRLERGIPQTLNVRDERSRPIQGAVVRYGESLVPVALTDEAGTATIAGSFDRALDYQVESQDLGYGEVQLPASGQSRERPFLITLEPPAVLEGRVIDKETGDPMPMALVWSTYRTSDFAFTNQDGRYRLPTWTSSRGLMLRATAAGYSKEDIPMSGSLLERGEAPTVGLESLIQIAAGVVDTRGEPVAGAAVQVAPRNPGGIDRRSIKQFESDSEGGLALRGLKQGSFQVTVKHPDFVPQSELLTVTADVSPEALEFVLEDGIGGWGAVVTEEDQPVAGARVWLEKVMSQPQRFGRFGQYGLEGEPAAETTTNAEGRFELAHLEPGNYNLLVEAAGMSTEQVPGVTIDVDQMEVGTVVLSLGLTLKGRLRDDTGEPAQGLNITLSSRPNPANLTDRRHDQQATVSGQDGSFEFGSLRAGRYSLQVHSKDFVAEQRSLELPLQAPLDIRLTRGHQLTGTIRNGDGEPLRAMTMLMHPPDEHGHHQQAGNAYSAEDGTYRMQAQPSGEYIVLAQAQGFAPSKQNVVVGNGTTADFTLERGASLSGRLTGDGGRPVAGAMVSLDPIQDQQGRPMDPALMYGGVGPPTISDGDGRYLAQGLTEGPQRIQIAAEGYMPIDEPVEISGDLSTFDKVLSRGFAISGQVIDEEGRPIEGAFLTKNVSQNLSSWSNQGLQYVTDSRGAFEMSGLAPGYYRINALKEDFANGATDETLRITDADLSGVKITLERGHRLTGQVTGLEPEELTRVRLMAMKRVDERSSEGNQYSQVPLSYDGSFNLQNVTTGTWTVTANLTRERVSENRTNGFSTETRRSIVKVLEVTGPISDIQLHFGPGITLSGTVTLDGEPLEGAMVYTSTVSGSTVTATTDEAGYYSLSGLASGSTAFQTRIDKNISGTIQHVEVLELTSDQTLDVDLRSGGLEVLVLSPEGEPLEAARVALVLPSKIVQSIGSTDVQGRLQARVLADQVQAGAQVQASRWDHGTTRVSLEPGDAGPVTIILEPAEAITVDVRLPDGSPAPAASLWLQKGDLTMARSGSGNAPGTYTLKAPPGSYTLWAVAAEFSAQPVQVTTPGPAVTITLSPAGFIRWTGTEDLSVHGIRIQARHSSGALHPMQSQIAPHYSPSVGPLTPGTWTLEFSDYFGETETKAVVVEVIAGATVEAQVP